MSDTLELQAAISTTPTVGNPTGVPTVSIPVELELALVNKSVQQYDLATDSPQALDLSMFPNGVNVISMQATGGRVKARLTSEFGSAQALPVDPYLFHTDQSGSITAIDVTRDAGVETLVFVFLGSTS